MSDFPRCPKCEQKALHQKQPDTDDSMTCAACGHVLLASTREARDAAQDALYRRFGGSVERFALHWESKLRVEREKVAKLKEGRW